MQKILLGILFLFLPAVALAQASAASSSYQPATITQVKPYLSPGNSNPDDALYLVSIRVGQTIYVVLTPVPAPSDTALYAVGRQLLVHIGDDAITWHDIMGQSYKAAIISKTVVGDMSKPHS